MFFVLLNMYLSKHCMLFTCGGNKEYYYYYCSSLLKFRLSNHRLPVETGRWENTPLEDRKCILCRKYDIGDEFHYLFVCDHFISDRKKY